MPQLKRSLAAVTAVVTGVFLYAMVGAKQEGLNATVKSDGNSELQDIINDLSTKQDQYLLDHGGYWQGLKTKEESDTSGKSDLKNKPSYVDIDWEQMGVPVPANSRYSFQTDVYSGPKGKGYTVKISTIENGILYEKRINFGPETHRQHDWRTNTL